MIRLVQRKLIIPRGDTGSFTMPTVAAASANDVAIFTIFDYKTKTKIFEKTLTASGNTLTFEFSHNDTVNLPPGKYVWDVKFYKNPVYADEELVNGEEIDSYYAGYTLPDCEIRETGDNLLVSADAPTATLAPAQLDIISAAIADVHNAVAQTETNVTHYPYVGEDNHWYLWDATVGAFVDSNVVAIGPGVIIGGTTGQFLKKATSADYDTVWGDETDPTVPAWAKEATKPTYTPAEIGALPDDTFIPTKVSDLEDDSGHYTKPITGIPPEDLAETYLTSFIETDPTVPAWAKAQNKPSYTAAEVGALPDSTFIPANTSDLINDSNFAVDANYVHTDNNYTTDEKTKLSGIAAGAEVNVNADWNAVGGDAQILNKPTNVSAFTNDAGYLTQHQDISGKADKTDTVLLTTLSRDRKANTTVGTGSIAWGVTPTASGTYSTAVGGATTASGTYSTAIGQGTQASAANAVAEGAYTVANGSNSHAEGMNTIANHRAQHALGEWNEADSSEVNYDARGNYVVIVGNGAQNARSNAYTLDWSGNAWHAGKVSAGTVDSPATPTAANDLTTKSYVDNAISTLNTMVLHICAAGEYNAETGVPTVQTPDTNTLYLVPGGSDNNLYVEWAYVNNAWEMFGSADIDLSAYALKTDTVLETTLSGGRKSGTTVGSRSIAFGHDATASSPYSFAIGMSTTASSQSSYAEGLGTTASGLASHAEGDSTVASGSYSHAMGRYTVAPGYSTFAAGCYNSMTAYPSWKANTSYSVGDLVTRTIANMTIGYKCIQANSDSSFTSSKWQSLSFNSDLLFTVGNGTADARSNAFALSPSGDGHFMGDVYVGANADSTGGSKLAKFSDITVTDVQVDGTSVLSSGVANIPKAQNDSFGAVKPYVNNGIAIENGTGRLFISRAATAVVKNGANDYRPIVPSNQHESTFYGLAKAAGADMSGVSNTTIGIYPDAQKAAIQNMLGIDTMFAPNETDPFTSAHSIGELFTMNGKLYRAKTAIVTADAVNIGVNCEEASVAGNFPHDVQVNGTSIVQNGVANVPLATASNAGVIKFSVGGALIDTTAHDGTALLQTCSVPQLKKGTNLYFPVTPYVVDAATFYGLSKVAGADLANETVTLGTYPDTSKAAIQSMLGISNLLAPTETDPFTSAHAIGDLFTMNGKLYRAKTAIAVADAFALGTNVEEASIAGNFVHDVQVDGTSIVSGGVANIPFAANAANAGVVKVNANDGVGISNGELFITASSSSFVKAGTHVYRPIVPSHQHESVFYGLSKVAGVDLANETVTLGTYPDTSKTAIQSMLGVPSKDSIDNAGITARTYTAKFNGEFTVTTASTTGYISPYARATSTGNLSENNLCRVTINDTQYVLPVKLYYDQVGNQSEHGHNVIIYKYIGNIGLYISDTSAIMDEIYDVPFVIITNRNQYGSIDVLTENAGQYTILVEEIVLNQKRLPESLIYGNSYYPIAVNSRNTTTGLYPVSIGVNSISSNVYDSYAIGIGNVIENSHSFAIGAINLVSGTLSAAIGRDNTVSGDYACAAGNETVASGNSSFSCGEETTASGRASHAEGGTTVASAPHAHAEGNNTQATLDAAHSEGINTIAAGAYSHAEGNASSTDSSAVAAHAEGYSSQATASYAHAEGRQTIASGSNAHAEGTHTTASANSAHAEGDSCVAEGKQSHAEGGATIARASRSHTEGLYTIASGQESHVGGKYNVEDSHDSWSEWVANTSYAVGDKVKVTTTANNQTTVAGYVCKTANSDSTFTVANWTEDFYKNYVEIVGNGTADNARSNARALSWEGDERLAGDVYVHCNNDSTGGVRLPYDVRVVSSSVVSNGVANITAATSSQFGVVKIGTGLYMDNNGRMQLNTPPDSVIKAGSLALAPIAPSNQHTSVFYGLAKAAGDSTQAASDNAVGTYTDSAKSSIRSMIGAASPELIAIQTETPTSEDTKLWINDTSDNGVQVPTVSEMNTALAGKVSDVIVAGTSVVTSGVAAVPFAASGVPGVVQIAESRGIQMYNSVTLAINRAVAAEVKAGANGYKPITPIIQDSSVYYGLSKLAGADLASETVTVGTYPDSSKGAIQTLLGVDDLIASKETDLTADVAYATGDLFLYNGKLYRATAAIAKDATIVIGTNCEVVKIGNIMAQKTEIPTVTSDLTNDSYFVSAAFSGTGLVLATTAAYAEEVSF